MAGSPYCSNTASSGYGILEVNPPGNSTPAWTTGARYDLATGLGSVNAANLVKNWSSISFQPSTTTLASLSPTTLTHGQPVNFTVNVKPGSGSGTPTGGVSLIAQTGVSSTNVTGIGPFPLSGGSVSSSTNMLPGGTYGVTAHYPGNGTYGASDSTPPVQVTVNPEGSQTHVALLTFDPVTGQETSSNATSLVYGSSFEILRVDVTNSSGQDCSPTSQYSCPTGQITLGDNGWSLNPSVLQLNSEGYAESQNIQLWGGTNNMIATYSGDGSYDSSTSPTDTITVTPAPTTTSFTGLPSSSVGGNVSFAVTVSTTSYGAGPTGTIQLLNNGAPLGGVSGVSGTSYSPSTGAYAQVSQQFGGSLPPGVDKIAVQYSGDVNYAASTSAASTISVTDFSLSFNPSSVNISAAGQSATSTITLAPLGGFTGTVALTCNTTYEGISCTISPSSVNLSGSSAVTATLTISTTGPVNAVLPAPPRRAPTSYHLPLVWSWLLAALLALTTFISMGAARRRALGWLSATALLVVGMWVACGGGGGGGSPPPVLAPLVTLSTTSLTFSQQGMGLTSTAQAVTLSNTGSASLAISNITFSGANPGDFAQTNNCGSIVYTGTNCTINVTFTPSATGARSASLNIADNASGSPQTVSLAGTGVAAPIVNLSPSSLAFGQENMWVTTAPQSVTLSNTGNAALSISTVTFTGAQPFGFAQSNTCGTSVAVGANCAFSVTFTPNSTGTFSASLSIADNAGGSPQTVSLSGTGLSPVTPAGTYYCFVSAVSGSETHMPTITINVQ
jgi:hypothetical protein